MVSLKSNNKLPIEIVAKDKFGNKAALDSAPTWSFDPSSLGQFTVSENGMSAEFVPSGEIGKGLVSVSGLENGQPLTGSLEIEVIAGDAVSFTVEPGMPTEV